ncbi:helix-turn-helix domain-containing protein [Bacillus spizizenii]|nr:helix-turn-helix domain-containing protein [Bacillus spizizenii]MCY8219418.1 helix-turn-helix domain-containing protein [Bacillus spizizenii]MCY8362142.1 helix-turn-helix domain-containing protein [Bacillus spizizenii]MCY8368666.1 helix-turn-helix domain-containing protein [Bacillus spizizenii]
MTEDEKIKFIQDEVLTAVEVRELLDISKQRLSQIVDSGKLKPVKKVGLISLYLRSHVEVQKKEAEVNRKKYRPYDQ